MTDLLQKAIASVRTLTSEEQDDIARMMLAMADAEASETVDPAHLSAVHEGLEQAKRREFATDEEIAAVLRRFNA